VPHSSSAQGNLGLSIDRPKTESDGSRSAWKADRRHRHWWLQSLPFASASKLGTWAGAAGQSGCKPQSLPVGSGE